MIVIRLKQHQRRFELINLQLLLKLYQDMHKKLFVVHFKHIVKPELLEASLKKLIDHILEIKELPTKTAKKDKSCDLTLQKKIKFTESQIERCNQKINHALKKYLQK